MQINDKTRTLEVLAVVLTGLGKFIFMDWLNWRLPYILAIAFFWIGYVWYRARQERGILDYWGIGKVNFKKTFLELLPVGLLCVVAFLLIGNYRGTNILNWHIIPILLLYPLWGVVQQFIVVGLITKNLRDMERTKLSAWLIVLMTALIFAVVHYPHHLLICGTFVLALVYAALSLKNRNLIVLGTFHGWLGAFFYYTVLGRDAWQEVFGMLLS